MAALLDHRGNPLKRSVKGPRVMHGRYDAAQTSEENRRHWAESDGLSARAANSPEVRKRLRDRCRYEVANNSWAEGVANALANFVVGSGPRLQVLTPSGEFNRIVEREYADWADAICLADKLWLQPRVRAVDGESFLFFDTDEDLPTPVKFDLRAYEADQVASPYAYPITSMWVDGIELNAAGKPATYHLLYEHPGDAFAYRGMMRFERVPASRVIHWFRVTRPGQYRGIPEFTQSLNLFANLRRYRDATIAAAETAANFAAVLYSDQPPAADEIPEGEPWEKIPIEKRVLMTVPAGWKMSQFKPEQPTTGHPEFVRSCLTELATGHSITYEIASGDYSNVNYSSGRLGHQRFERAVAVDRDRMERVCLNRILREWLSDAVDIGLIPDYRSRSAGWAHRWLWPAIEGLDPEKDANAQATRFQNYTTTFSAECARDGVDRDARLDEIERDVADFAARGLPSPYGQPTPAPSASPPPAQRGDDNESRPTQGRGNGRAGRDLVHRNGNY